MSSFHRTRNRVRKQLTRWVLPLLSPKVQNLLRHSLNRPFGNRYYQDRAERYDEQREHQRSWTEEYRALEKIATKLGRDLSVLDVPVGTGRFFPIYAELKWQICGLDVSDDMLKVARSRLDNGEGVRPTLRAGKATDLPFGDSEFDVVVCFRFLQSIVSFGTAKRVISEIARVSNKYVVLHLDVKPDGLPENRLPKSKATMRGNLSLPQIEDLLGAKGLQIQEKIGPMPHETKNEFVFLCVVDNP